MPPVRHFVALNFRQPLPPNGRQRQSRITESLHRSPAVQGPQQLEHIRAHVCAEISARAAHLVIDAASLHFRRHSSPERAGENSLAAGTPVLADVTQRCRFELPDRYRALDGGPTTSRAVSTQNGLRPVCKRFASCCRSPESGIQIASRRGNTANGVVRSSCSLKSTDRGRRPAPGKVTESRGSCGIVGLPRHRCQGATPFRRYTKRQSDGRPHPNRSFTGIERLAAHAGYQQCQHQCTGDPANRDEHRATRVPEQRKCPVQDQQEKRSRRWQSQRIQYRAAVRDRHYADGEILPRMPPSSSP